MYCQLILTSTTGGKAGNPDKNWSTVGETMSNKIFFEGTSRDRKSSAVSRVFKPRATVGSILHSRNVGNVENYRSIRVEQPAPTAWQHSGGRCMRRRKVGGKESSSTKPVY